MLATLSATTATPTVASIIGPTGNAYRLGQQLEFTVVATEPVVVGGVPTLQFTLGTADSQVMRTATYVGGSGTSALRFAYTATQADDGRQGVAVTGPLALPLAARVPLLADAFSVADGSPRGTWSQVFGNHAVSSGRLVGAASGASMLRAGQAAAVNQSVEAMVQVAPMAGHAAGVVARLGGPGNQNFYLGQVVSRSGRFFAEVWRSLDGVMARLGASTRVASGRGMLRLDVQGNSLSLFMGSATRPLVQVSDNAIAGTGGAGVWTFGQNSTVDNFGLTGLQMPAVIRNAAWASLDPAFAPSVLPGIRIDGTSPSVSLSPVAPAVTTGVSSIDVNFSEPVSGVTLQSFQLTRNGVRVPLSGASLSGGGRSFKVEGLAPSTVLNGGYTLTLSPTGIADAAGNALRSGISASWQTTLGVPAAPSGLTAKTGHESLAVSWTPLPAVMAPTAYVVSYRETGSQGGWWTRTVTSPATTLVITGLEPKTDYDVTVRGRNAKGEGLASQAVRATSLPTPPKPAVEHVWAGDRIVELYLYDPPARTVTPDLDYVVQYRSVGSEPWLTFDDGVGISRFIRVTGLTNGQPYEFRLQAFNAAGGGEVATLASPVTPVLRTVPGVMEAPEIDLVERDYVNMKWTPPHDGHAAISSYDLQYRRQSDPNGWLTKTVVMDNPNAWPGGQVYPLVPGTPYVFRVAARNWIGRGEFSPESVVVVPSSAPDPVIIGQCYQQVEGVVQLHFHEPASGGYPILGYRVRMDDGYSAREAPLEILPSTDVFGRLVGRVTGLTNGTRYRLSVAAVTQRGSGEFYHSYPITPTGPVVAPSDFRVQAGSGNVTVSWTRPVGTASISGYAIQYATNPKALAPNGWWEGVQHIAVGPNELSTTITGLQNGVTYYFRLAGSNSVGYGDWTPTLAATPAFVPTAPSAPQSLVVAAGNGFIDVSWSPPAEIGGGRLSAYRLEVSTSRSFTGVIRTETTSSTSFRVGSLVNGATYYFRVAASNTAYAFFGGFTDWAAASPKANPSADPQAPVNLTVQPGDGQVTLSWQAPTSGPRPVDYLVRVYDGDAGTWRTLSTPVTGTTTTVTGLQNGRSYAFRVASRSGGQTSGWSGSSGNVAPRPGDAPPPGTVAFNHYVVTSNVKRTYTGDHVETIWDESLGRSRSATVTVTLVIDTMTAQTPNDDPAQKNVKYSYTGRLSLAVSGESRADFAVTGTYVCLQFPKDPFTEQLGSIDVWDVRSRRGESTETFVFCTGMEWSSQGILGNGLHFGLTDQYQAYFPSKPFRWTRS